MPFYVMLLLATAFVFIAAMEASMLFNMGSVC